MKCIVIFPKNELEQQETGHYLYIYLYNLRMSWIKNSIQRANDARQSLTMCSFFSLIHSIALIDWHNNKLNRVLRKFLLITKATREHIIKFSRIRLSSMNVQSLHLSVTCLWCLMYVRVCTCVSHFNLSVVTWLRDRH